MDIGRWLFLCYIGGAMSRELHNRLLKKVVNAPVNLYFDVTPVGKLLKYFTEDIGRTDRAFFWHINWCFDSIADCLIKISIACYFSKWMALVVTVNMILLYRVQTYTFNGKDEAQRLSSKFNGKKHKYL